MMDRMMGAEKKRPERRLFPETMAEREGFEPSIRLNRIPDFESGAFDHSATFPLEAMHYIQLEPEIQLFMQVLQCER